MAKRTRGRGRPRDVEKREAFALWWSLPKSKREPRTLEKWLEANELVHSTTWRWRQDPEFRQKVLSLRMEVAEESMTDIVQGLTNKAVEGELGQAKFLLELLGDYLPKSEVQHLMGGSQGANGVSPDMIEFVAEEMLEHPKMVTMPLKDLIEILSEILLEEED